MLDLAVEAVSTNRRSRYRYSSYGDETWRKSSDALSAITARIVRRGIALGQRKPQWVARPSTPTWTSAPAKEMGTNHGAINDEVFHISVMDEF